MSTKKEIFLVNVTVLEGRHFAWLTMDSFVRIKIGNYSQRTGVRKSTDCPFYNEYFVFEFRTDLQTLLDKHITLTVIKPGKCWCRRKILGYCTLDVATVWNQPDHIFYQKWAILTSRSVKQVGPRGYLKVTLTVVTKDSQAKLPLANPNINDEIEGNLLLPDGLTLQRQRAIFVFKVYKGEDILKRKTILDKCRKNPRVGLPSTLVEVKFAGITASTSIQKRNQNPTWNEQLTIAELYPPLSQRVKVQLRTRGSRIRAVKYLYIHSIANDQENGFLPTFGPAYIHFYNKDRFGDVYAGKVLMALHTQLQHDYLSNTRTFTKKTIPYCNETALWKSEPILLFCAILSVNSIDKRFCKKTIQFEISVGPRFADWDGDNVPNISDGIKPITTDKTYWYLDFKGRIPCINYQNHFPDLRRRFYNKNMIRKISKELKKRLDDIEPLFQYERCRIPSGLIGKKLEEALSFLSTQCRNYIEIASQSIGNQATELDQEKTKLCIREIEDIEKQAKSIYNFKTKKKSYRKAQKLYIRLSLLEDHPQDCWPDVLIYMIYNRKKVAARLIESEDVVFSNIPEEMGPLCGKIYSISLNTPLKLQSLKHSITACKMDLFLWLGLRKDMEYCFNILPNDFKHEFSETSLNLPRYLSINNKVHFQCRAHIYQGRFNFGADVTGLSDHYIRVILNGESACTKIIKGKLNPLWDETVVIPRIVIYGSGSFIKENPPTCIIEVVDYDDILHSQYVGRVHVKPSVKLRSEPYTKPDFPPVLKWYDVIQKKLCVGKVLLCIELLEITSSLTLTSSSHEHMNKIPEDIRPILSGYKTDILFWGVRHTKKLFGMPITRPKIIVDFTVTMTESETTTSNFPNFDPKYQDVLISLPVEQDYIPSLAINLTDNRPFGKTTYIANHITTIDRFLYYPLTREERDYSLSHLDTKSYDSMESKESLIITKKKFSQETQTDLRQQGKEKLEEAKIKIQEAKKNLKSNLKKQKQNKCSFLKFWKRKKKEKDTNNEENVEVKKSKSIIVDMESKHEDDFVDWWTKYFLSWQNITETEETTSTVYSKNFRVKIYEEELEYQPEFNGFQDTIATFPLLRGERGEGQDVNIKYKMGVFKGNLKVYPWPPKKGIEYVSPTGRNLQDGYFQDAPNNDKVGFIARIYCIRGIKLRPKDLSGQADPFLVAFMGDQYISRSKEYVSKQINPIFGSMFEFSGTFPTDSIVTIQVWDYDRYSSHDLIGETTIDIENRFYTKHRARCGLAYEYSEKGATVWRDVESPTKILKDLCKLYQLESPQYYDTYVRIGELIFPMTISDGEISKAEYSKEELALDLLHKWHKVPVVGCHLVPEHVETRSLYNSKEPGIEQGKLQLWVDIFATSDLPPPPPVHIVPRKPDNYELRVVILNTEDVILQEDDFFIGEKKSDIFIKGWLVGIDEVQSTDVHYRSLNGEGNFNWRFVFPFNYLKTENKIVVQKKQLFQAVSSERKIPCKLKLQVWDNDTFSADDFLGSLTLDLSSMPRGAKSPQLCSLKLLEGNSPQINLFKTKRTKGWWPFQGFDEKTKEYILAGKVEAEFEIVHGDEAQVNPVGKGRNEPHPLPKPKKTPLSTLKETYSSTLSYISSIKSQVASGFSGSN